jgi:hypothetical protein
MHERLGPPDPPGSTYPSSSLFYPVNTDAPEIGPMVVGRVGLHCAIEGHVQFDVGRITHELPIGQQRNRDLDYGVQEGWARESSYRLRARRRGLSLPRRELFQR